MHTIFLLLRVALWLSVMELQGKAEAVERLHSKSKGNAIDNHI
jgi:hypothetical protein